MTRIVVDQCRSEFRALVVTDDVGCVRGWTDVTGLSASQVEAERLDLLVEHGPFVTIREVNE